MITPFQQLHWSGALKIQLRPQDAAGSALQNRVQAVAFLNRAFEVFYECRAGIAQCSDTEMRQQLIQELEDAAITGPDQTTCSDLRSAMCHAAAEASQIGTIRHYRWRDDQLQIYSCTKFHQQLAFDAFGARRPTIWQEGDVSSAKAAVQFLHRMDEKLWKLQDGLARFETAWREVDRAAVELHRRGGRSTDGDWRALGHRLRNMVMEVKRAQRYMWLAGARLHERFAKLNATLGSSVSVPSAVTRFNSLADRMIKGTATFATLKDALDLLCVMGSFYGSALGLIPGAADWINRVYAQRWSRLQLLRAESNLVGLADLVAAQGVLGPQPALCRFPYLGAYRQPGMPGLRLTQSAQAWP